MELTGRWGRDFTRFCLVVSAKGAWPPGIYCYTPWLLCVLLALASILWPHEGLRASGCPDEAVASRARRSTTSEIRLQSCTSAHPHARHLPGDDRSRSALVPGSPQRCWLGALSLLGHKPQPKFDICGYMIYWKCHPMICAPTRRGPERNDKKTKATGETA